MTTLHRGHSFQKLFHDTLEFQRWSFSGTSTGPHRDKVLCPSSGTPSDSSTIPLSGNPELPLGSHPKDPRKSPGPSLNELPLAS